MKSKVKKLKQDKGKVRGDMYQPASMLTLSILCTAIGVACGIGAVLNFSLYSLIIALLFVVLGVFLFLLWKNQKIIILSDTQFEYNCPFGKKFVYNFKDIKGLKKGSVRSRLFVGKDKIPVYSTSIMSKDLITAIDSALKVKKNVK